MLTRAGAGVGGRRRHLPAPIRNIIHVADKVHVLKGRGVNVQPTISSFPRTESAPWCLARVCVCGVPASATFEIA